MSLISQLIRGWLLLELLNWLIYLIIYINILTPRYLFLKNQDTDKIIKRIDKLSVTDLEYIIKGCIIYNKENHVDVTVPLQIDIKDITINEITNIIGYSLFGIDINQIKSHSKYDEIKNIITKIEKILDIKFKLEEKDKYVYRRWGSDFIKFSFRPLFIQLPIRIAVNYFHWLFVKKYNYEYTICNKTKISYLTKISNPQNKTIFFIHGFGFGYIPYFQIIKEMEKKHNIILMVLPNISSYRFYDDLMYIYFPSLSNIKESIFSYLDNKKSQIDLTNCVMLSHSFGTYIARILERDTKSKIYFRKIIMVDPIIFWIGCFKMCLHIANPNIDNSTIKSCLIDILGNYLIYDCIYHKYVCFRVMFGPDFWIYNSSELVQTNIEMVFEKGDYIIPAELLYNKTRDKIKCYYINDDKAVHGTIMMTSKYLDNIISIVDDA